MHANSYQCGGGREIRKIRKRESSKEKAGRNRKALDFNKPRKWERKARLGREERKRKKGVRNYGGEKTARLVQVPHEVKVVQAQSNEQLCQGGEKEPGQGCVMGTSDSQSNSQFGEVANRATVDGYR